MMKNRKLKGIAGLFLLVPAMLFAQYPDVPSDLKAAAEKMIREESANAKGVLKAHATEMKEWTVKGKPFIQWAARPTDLPQANIPAFPGAEGGGKYSFGGRGGKVVVVTSLADRGPGTLREACQETVGPRIVVFNVAGIIKLNSPIIIEAPYITIAGQTAPGDGICVAGESFWVNTHDVVVRHMRFAEAKPRWSVATILLEETQWEIS